MALRLATLAAGETLKRGDPVEHARSLVRLAAAAYEASRNGIEGTRGAAEERLAEAVVTFEQHLPDTRADLANAHYLTADMARGRDGDIALRHYEAAVALVRRDEEPALWAAVNEGLAATLIRGPHGDRPEVQERSIALYYEALTVEPPLVPPNHWALTAHGLTLTLVERHRGQVIDNWASALDFANRALALATTGDDHRLTEWVFEMSNRARIGFGVAALMGRALPDADGVQCVREGARGLDVLRGAGDALGPLAERLAAEVAVRVERDETPSTGFLEAARMLLQAIHDRRGRLVVHVLLAASSDDAGVRATHTGEAQRLISPHDDEAVRGGIAMLRAAAPRTGSP